MNKELGLSRSILNGAAAAMPVVLAYIPIGLTYGILASAVGFSPLMTILMSILVLGGSAQFIAVGLVAAKASVFSIVLMTFVVNLRHLLMSAAMVPYLRDWPKFQQILFGLELTDESFSVNMGRFPSRGVNKAEIFSINLFSHIGWVLGACGGVFFGNIIGDISIYGLDYALPAMFLALILPHFKIPRRVLALALGFSLSAILALCGAKQWSVIIATFLAAFLAAFMPGWKKKDFEL